MEYVAKEWVTKLNNETEQIWEQNKNEKDHSKGFAIFYSLPPYKRNPKIAFIGINPGGDEKDFTIPPIENEYFNATYRLARKIRKIFKEGGLMQILENEDYVKFNLYFFRSKEAKDIKNNKEMKKFCEDKVLEILKVIQPKYIIAEGIGTYERLKVLLNANEEWKVNPGKNRIFCFAKTENDIPLLGIIHPTGAYGISDEILDKIGNKLKEIIEK